MAKIVKRGASITDNFNNINEEFEDIRNIAEGKTKSYVTNTSAEPRFRVQDASVTINGGVSMPGGSSVAVETLRIGDIFYLTDTDYPDRWVSAVNNPQGGTPSATFNILETQKVPLENYVLKTTTVNGHQLSSNVTVTASDVGLGDVEPGHRLIKLKP